MRFALVIYLILAPGSASQVQPIEIPQSTELSCKQQGEKVKADVHKQVPETTVIVLCVDKGSAY